jgi:23S rRNA (guanosine2251-2'-O)-methyltransferase
MIVFGKNPVKEALQSDATIEKLIVEKGNFDAAINALIAQAKQKNILVSFADKSALDRYAEGGRHQGVVAVTTEFNYSSLDEILDLAGQKNQKPLVVLLDGITDPHNLGAIIRSAECLGAHGVVIPKHRACGVNGTVIKASAGAAEHLLVAKVTNLNDAIRRLKDEGIWVFAADLDGQSPASCDFTGATAIVVGSEGEGVKRLTKELCNGVVTIKQQGKIESLNASVAAGVLLYEIARQRKLA